jgi:hypothetical protein
MSDIPADWRGQLDLRAELERIDRNRAEMQKLLAEVTKLNSEERKFDGELTKLIAESRKYNRERWVIPVTVAGALLAAAVARLDIIARIFGWLS